MHTHISIMAAGNMSFHIVTWWQRIEQNFLYDVINQCAFMHDIYVLSIRFELWMGMTFYFIIPIALKAYCGMMALYQYHTLLQWRS